MSGELILENNGRWKQTVPAVLVTCLLAGGLLNYTREGGL